eukprot:2226168-Alexandrium_andersonii.AAC.1
MGLQSPHVQRAKPSLPKSSKQWGGRGALRLLVPSRSPTPADSEPKTRKLRPCRAAGTATASTFVGASSQ